MTYVPIKLLTPLVTPEPGLLMAVLHAYFDESGKEGDDQHSSVVVAGYLADLPSWHQFESNWQGTLTAAGVGALHMKDFANSYGEFSSWKGDEERRSAFLAELVSVISSARLEGFGAVVRLADLRRFNAERGQDISALPLALFLCTMHMYVEHPTATIEVVFDCLDKPYTVFDEARRYGKSQPGGEISYTMIPLDGKQLNSRNVLPIQAADFLAWETRKHHTRLDEWFSAFAADIDQGAWDEHLKEWMARHGKPWPNQRKSFSALLDATKQTGFIWSYTSLCQLDAIRRGVWA